MQKNIIKIGIAGLGTVGAETFQYIQNHQAFLKSRTGKDLIVTAVSARDKQKYRHLHLNDVTWCDNPAEMALRDDVDLVIELMGGADGAAFDLIQNALSCGKPIITANKALISKHAQRIFEKVNADKIAFAFEASVAGGIPIIKTIREGFAGNKITSVYGILNGTCNYILTEMAQKNMPFATVLKDAQDKGYAEADPSFDIDGIDTAHKLSILSAIAFGHIPKLDEIEIQGIRAITDLDINYADQLGYSIKLLGIAEETTNGISQIVAPCMLPKTASLSSVHGVFNAVFIKGDYMGDSLSVGRGAGGKATTSAIIADLIDICRGHFIHPLGQITQVEAKTIFKPIHQRQGQYYIRLLVKDEIGVIAEISAVLRDHKISLKSIIQHYQTEKSDDTVPVVITTHETNYGDVRAALTALSSLPVVMKPPHMMHILDL
jgi:homoserine dehydrogenase